MGILEGARKFMQQLLAYMVGMIDVDVDGGGECRFAAELETEAALFVEDHDPVVARIGDQDLVEVAIDVNARGTEDFVVHARHGEADDLRVDTTPVHIFDSNFNVIVTGIDDTSATDIVRIKNHSIPCSIHSRGLCPPTEVIYPILRE